MAKRINLNDPKHKEALHRLLSSNQILVVDTTKKMRSTLKRILAELGQTGGNIHFASTIEEGESYLLTDQANFLFTSYQDDERTCEQLIKRHFEHYPDRKTAGCFLFSHENNIYYASSFYLDYQLDAYFPIPFSAGPLKEGLISAFSKRLLTTKYQSQVYLGLSLLNMKEFESARDVFENALDLSKAPSQAHAYLGSCYQGLKEPAKAKMHFEKSLYYQLDNYLALNNLIDIATAKQDWKTAYKYQVVMMENYPFNPRLIPRLMVVSLRNQCYEDIYELAMSFSRLPIKNEQVQKHVAAGLVMSGRHFIKTKSDPETGRKILLKASDLSQGRIEIIRNVCFGLLEGGFFAEAYDLLGKYTEEHKDSPSFQILELEFLARTSKQSKTLLLGMELIRKGITTEAVYEVTIKAAVGLKRSISVVEDLVNDGCQKYPDKTSQFSHMLESYRVKS